MKNDDLIALKNAVNLLENPSLGVKIADLIGSPIEKAIACLPDSTKKNIGVVAQKAVQAALNLSLKTLDHQHVPNAKRPESSDWWHIAGTITTGAIGGAFGILALPIELPISTTIILRSIADVARSEGADLSKVDTQLECVRVLALGGPSRSDDDVEIGYFVVRDALATMVSNAAAHIAEKELDAKGAPALVQLIVKVAELYSITITEKAAGQLVPVIGAIAGAGINAMFTGHFQDMARGHFTVLRLESEYGQEVVRSKYASFKSQNRQSANNPFMPPSYAQEAQTK